MCTLAIDQARVLVENLEIVDQGALATDEDLTKEMIQMPQHDGNGPLGIVLISDRVKCINCGSTLYTRSDRSSRVTIYSDTLGTVPATHYTKYCRKQGCSYQQHCGFSTQGNSSVISYDPDWRSLPYFMSSRETAFAVDMLQRLDVEVLLGQISYKQRADIYNEVHL